jgi:RNA polymerase sigma factor (sigma-70 family)
MFLLHQGLVRAIAWKTHQRVPHHVEIDDLIAYGQIGLLEAITAFDAERGRKFTTYAWHRIRGAILDGLGTMSWFNRAKFERSEYEQPAALATAGAAADAPSARARRGGVSPVRTPTVGRVYGCPRRSAHAETPARGARRLRSTSTPSAFSGEM